jgi:hypothetical protein
VYEETHSLGEPTGSGALHSQVERRADLHPRIEPGADARMRRRGDDTPARTLRDLNGRPYLP